MVTPPDPDAAGWVLHLRPVADPLYPRDSGHARPGDYRLRLALKCLLRGFGLRCVAVTDPTGGAAAIGPAAAGPSTDLPPPAPAGYHPPALAAADAGRPT